MIRLNVFIQVNESNRNAVLETAKELVAQSLNDNGCIAYDPVIHLDPTKTNQGLYKQALIYFYPPRKVMQETLFHQCNHCLKK